MIDRRDVLATLAAELAACDRLAIEDSLNRDLAHLSSGVFFQGLLTGEAE